MSYKITEYANKLIDQVDKKEAAMKKERDDRYKVHKELWDKSQHNVKCFLNSCEFEEKDLRGKIIDEL